VRRLAGWMSSSSIAGKSVDDSDEALSILHKLILWRTEN